MEITEQKVQSLQMKMRSSELCWKERQLFTACSKIAWTSVKAGKTKLLPVILLRVQEIISQQAFNSSLVEWALKLLSFTSLTWPEIAI